MNLPFYHSPARTTWGAAVLASVLQVISAGPASAAPLGHVGAARPLGHGGALRTATRSGALRQVSAPWADEPEENPTAPPDADANDELERARASFLAGRDLMKEARWISAAAAFQKALAIRPTPGLHYYIGYCQEQAGKLSAARRSYEAAGELARDVPAPDVEELLPTAVRRVSAQLGRLLIDGAPVGARLTIDGQEHPARGEIWLEPGKHILRVRAAGYVPRELELGMVRGQAERLDLRLQKTGAPPPQAGVAGDSKGSEPYLPSDRPESSPLREGVFWGSLAVGAGGAALAVAGVVLASEAGARIEEAARIVDAGSSPDLQACNQPSADLQGPCDDLDRAAVDQGNATTLAVIGFSVMVLGGTSAILSRTLWKTEKVALSAEPSFGGVGLQLRGQF